MAETIGSGTSDEDSSGKKESGGGELVQGGEGHFEAQGMCRLLAWSYCQHVLSTR